MYTTTATAELTPEINFPVIARDVAAAGLFLVVLQILDGVLTAVGISHWGTSAEGNYLIRLLMDEVGFVNALILVKSFAVATIFTLMLLSVRVSWVATALKCLIAVYLSAAVVPWTILLIQKYV